VQNVKIFEVRGPSNPNYLILRQINERLFYWNGQRFTTLKPGDFVFVINRIEKEALFVWLVRKDLEATYYEDRDLSRFKDERTFNVKGKWGPFIRFEILDRRTIPKGWQWTKTLGPHTVYDIWKEDGSLAGQVDRMNKISDLGKIFTTGEAKKILQDCGALHNAALFNLALRDTENYETGENSRDEDLVMDPEEEMVDFIEPGDELRQLLIATRTKPFVLLAGISGIGKSRLARTLAYKTCAMKQLRQENPLNFLLIHVRPSWNDSTDLLGYQSDITGSPQYKLTPFIKFLLQAWKYPQVPFFLCLDEMNLAPVELYMAEYLSAIESRRYDNGVLFTDPLIPADVFARFNKKEFWAAAGIEGDSKSQERLLKYGLGIPGNFIVIGTVNMDETTHSFSRKVLDRAMTIEMTKVNLREGLEKDKGDWDYPTRFYSKKLVCGEYTSASEIYGAFDPDKREKVLGLLEQVNGALENTPFKVAYRTGSEALLYCYYHSFLPHDKDGYWVDQALDEIICMKVLSRIEGDEAKCSVALTELVKLFTLQELNGCRIKAQVMLDHLHQFGYTSYFP